MLKVEHCMLGKGRESTLHIPKQNIGQHVKSGQRALGESFQRGSVKRWGGTVAVLTFSRLHKIIRETVDSTDTVLRTTREFSLHIDM